MVASQSNYVRLFGDYLGEPLTTTSTSTEGGWNTSFEINRPDPKDKIAEAMQGYYAKNGRLYRKGE